MFKIGSFNICFIGIVYVVYSTIFDFLFENKKNK